MQAVTELGFAHRHLLCTSLALYFDETGQLVEWGRPQTLLTTRSEFLGSIVLGKRLMTSFSCRHSYNIVPFIDEEWYRIKWDFGTNRMIWRHGS